MIKSTCDRCGKDANINLRVQNVQLVGPHEHVMSMDLCKECFLNFRGKAIDFLNEKNMKPNSMKIPA